MEEAVSAIIDTYLHEYDRLEEGGMFSYDCDYGEFTFSKQRGKTLILHGIFIYPHHREKGVCRDTLRLLIDKAYPAFTRVCVQSVLSKILYEYLERFTYKGAQFVNTKDGFVYKIEMEKTP